jgi:UDP-glucuronate decarboxylase
MEKKNTLLWTGATGFFGKALLRHLKEHGTGTFDWHLVSRNPENFILKWPDLAQQKNVIWHRGDIQRLIKEDFPPVTHVVHAAADSTNSSYMTALQQFDQIVNGTRQVLDLAVACGAKRFLLVSSGGVYGPQPPGVGALTEDFHAMPDPLNSRNSYGVGKRAAEHLCALYAEQYGIEVVIARCFAFIGEDLPLDAHYAVGNFIRDALWNEKLIVKGNGSPTRSYLDQRDLIRWLLALLFSGRAGEAYNVGGSDGISIADLAHLVRDILSPNKAVTILGNPGADESRNRYIPDIRKIQLDIGMRPVFSLQMSLRKISKSLSR